MELIDRITGYLDSGKLPVSVFVDLSKAFDTLNHAILLEKLKYYGFSGTSLNWFRSYLTDRNQFTEFNCVKSAVTKLTTGVPQGSILGPLVFIIYMNDIHMATNNFKTILYADDINLISPLCSFSSMDSLHSSNLPGIASSINAELSNIQTWLIINKLTVSVKQTKFKIFHYPQRKIENLIPDVKFNSQTIERVSEFNFLRLTIDECPSWKPHIQKVSNKVSRTIGTLRRLKNFLPAHVLRTLYNTLILLHFHYSIAMWGFKMGLKHYKNGLYG